MRSESSSQLTRILLQENTSTRSFDSQVSLRIAGWLKSLEFAVESVEVDGIVYLCGSIDPKDADMVGARAT